MTTIIDIQHEDKKRFIVKARISKQYSEYIKLCELDRMPTDDELKMMYYTCGIPGASSEKLNPLADGVFYDLFKSVHLHEYDVVKNSFENKTETWDVRPLIIAFEVSCEESEENKEHEYVSLLEYNLLQIALLKMRVEKNAKEFKMEEEKKTKIGKKVKFWETDWFFFLVLIGFVAILAGCNVYFS